MRTGILVLVLCAGITAGVSSQQEPPFDVQDVQPDPSAEPETETEPVPTGRDAAGDAETGADGDGTETEAQWSTPEPEPLQAPSDADAAARISNVASDGWRIDMVEGDGIYVSGGNRSRMMLEVGNRYHFDLSTTNSELYPLEFRGFSGRVLFSQQQAAGTTQWPDADIEISDEGITFTLTEDLAEVIRRYRAAAFPQMTGFVIPVFPDDETAEEE